MTGISNVALLNGTGGRNVLYACSVLPMRQWSLPNCLLFSLYALETLLVSVCVSVCVLKCTAQQPFSLDLTLVFSLDAVLLAANWCQMHYFMGILSLDGANIFTTCQTCFYLIYLMSLLHITKIIEVLTIFEKIKLSLSCKVPGSKKHWEPLE